MTTFDSYLMERQLPDNQRYKMWHDIITLLTVASFSFYYLILYLSVESKESVYYKALAHLQMVSIFHFSCIWSLLFKLVPHLDYNFFYCEGYYYILGTSCSWIYFSLCFSFGIYSVGLVCSYMFRLYLLVDYNHFLKKPYVFPSIMAILTIVNSFLTAITYRIGYTEFKPESIQLNLTQEQIAYFEERSASMYKIKEIRELVYPILFLSVVFSCCVIGICIVVATVRTVQKKQSLMSAGTTKHHLRVLKMLLIQTVVCVSISGLVPLVISAAIFFDIPSNIMYVAILLMGLNSSCLCLVSLFVNPVSRRTVSRLARSHLRSFSNSVMSVDSVHK